MAIEEFDHLGIRFVSVQDQVDTDSPAVTAGMRAVQARGKHLGRPPTPQHVINEIAALATSTNLSIRQIHARIAGRASRGIVGEVTKRARAPNPTAL
ncbi:MAG TPA: hypothetical protein VD995_22520 [Azospirillum sp.]|nr:hypothetical protein [Azospirillum sp.]